MTTNRLVGCGTALVTPFTESGDIDEAALRDLVDWQIEEGVHFLVPCGSTGEAATLTAAEHRRVVEVTAQQAAGRVPICAAFPDASFTATTCGISASASVVFASMLLPVRPGTL